MGYLPSVPGFFPGFFPACDKKYTQVIKIAGYPNTTLGVRTNTLEFTNTQLIYTNQGPTQ